MQTLPNGFSATIGYTYDATGNRTSMTTPWGSFSYVYDSLNRLTQITNPQSKHFAFTYDSDSRRTSLTYPNGIVTNYTYDSAGQVLSINATRTSDNVVISSQAYTYDAAGDRTSMTDVEGTHSYGYDNLHRLTSASHPAGTVLPVQNEAFSYDPVGNRLADVQIGGYTYDGVNELTSNSGFTYTYDADGNVISKTEHSSNTQTTYGYNSQEELVTVGLPVGTNWNYDYDARLRRISKSSGMAAEQGAQYIYDGRNILAMLNNSNSPVFIFTNGQYVDEQLLLHMSGGGDYFYSVDASRSIRLLTDSNATVAERYAFSAFGVRTISDGAGVMHTVSITGNIFSFSARELDEETGFLNNRARYADPLIGRFASADNVSISLASGVNLYYYAEDRPTMKRDLEGERPTGADVDYPNLPIPNKPNIYGNYCGKGSDWTKQPIDALDMACLIHDSCYATLGVSGGVLIGASLAWHSTEDIFRGYSPSAKGRQTCEKPTKVSQCDSNLCIQASQFHSHDEAGTNAKNEIIGGMCYYTSN